MARIEAIVIHKNRRPTPVRLKAKQTHFNLNNKEYHLDPDATVFGRYYPWYKFKLGYNECNRYYFPEDSVKPIRFHEITTSRADELNPNLITPAELAQIFNPRFYEIIARGDKNPKQDLILWAVLATAAGIVYCAWQLAKIVGHLGI